MKSHHVWVHNGPFAKNNIFYQKTHEYNIHVPLSFPLSLNKISKKNPGTRTRIITSCHFRAKMAHLPPINTFSETLLI